MKNKDRIRMLLHPERYSDEQFDQMLEETNIPVPDTEEEWRKFKTKRQRHSHHNGMTRWAAIIVVVSALSGITYAAILHFMGQKGVVEETQAVASHDDRVEQEVESHDVLDVAPTVLGNDSTRQDQQFNNVELQQIMQQLSRDYSVKVVFKNEAKRKLRFYLKWEADDSIQEILNRINHFEKVHLTLSEETVTIE